MKKLSHIALAGLLAGAVLPAAAAAQQVQATPATPKTMKMEDHHAAGSGWKELDAFHHVMADTWHPIVQSNDLKVIRAMAPELAKAAEAWSAAKVPAACDKKEIRDAIAAVVSKSKDVAQLVAKQASDADVKAALRDTHDRFEVVEHGCHPSKG
jgi:hypothetical protein